jgi:hypothetical protein
MSAIEDTIVQVRDRAGDGWTDYARTTRAEALAAVRAGRLPGDSQSEPLRAVDWITKEEVAVTTRTSSTAAKAKATTTKARSDANGRAEKEAREVISEIVEEAAKPRRRSKPAVTTKRVEPQAPERSKFPAGVEGTKKFRAAEAAYEAALEAFRGDVTEAGGNVPPEAPEAKKATTTRRSTKAPAKPAKPESDYAKLEAAGAVKRTKLDGFDGTAKATIAKVIKLKTAGKTIKEIAETLGLPAEHRSWYAVSMVWRSEADRLGLDRPRRNGKESQ